MTGTINKNLADFGFTVYDANSTQVTVGNSTVNTAILQTGLTIANGSYSTTIGSNTATFGANALTVAANGNVGIGKGAAAYTLDVNGSVNFTGSLYSNGTNVSGGARGGGTDAVFFENDSTINSNYTISTNKNAMTAGPVTINSGVTVTVNTGSTWVIV